jgi:hypothetical protein
VGVTPSKAGTERKPAGVRLRVALTLSEPSAITGFEVWNGPGLAFDRGKGFAECPLAALTTGGPDACPAKSRLSAGAMTTFGDETAPSMRLTFFNAPGRRPVAYATLQRPARVRAVLVPTVKKARGVYPHRIAWTLPPILQVVAGVTVTGDRLSFALGGTRAAPRYIHLDPLSKGQLGVEGARPHEGSGDGSGGRPDGGRPRPVPPLRGNS